MAYRRYYWMKFTRTFHLSKWKWKLIFIFNPSGIYLLKISDRNTKAKREICLKLTIKMTFLVSFFSCVLLSLSSTFYLSPLSFIAFIYFLFLLLSLSLPVLNYIPLTLPFIFSHICVIISIFIIIIIITIIFLHASSPYSNAGIRQVSYSLILILISFSNTWCFAPIALIYLVITSHFLFNSSIWFFNFPDLLITIPR